MIPAAPGVVFDCVIFLQGVGRESGPSFACLELCERGTVTLYVSPRILREVVDVLLRPAVQRKLLRALRCLPERSSREAPGRV